MGGVEYTLPSIFKMDIPRVIIMNGNRVSFEPDTTQEQREKVLWSYAYEHAERQAAIKKNPLFQEAKNFFRANKTEIFKDPQNAHLRRSKHDN